MFAEKKPVVVVGSINIDLVANTQRIPAEGETVLGSDFQIHFGGKGANQAVAVARLGYPVCLIGRLGDDAFGDQLQEHLRGAGVDLAGVATSPGTSGVAIIVVADTGENSIVITPGANALLKPEDLDANIEILRSAGIVLTQLEIPMQTVEHLARICARERIPLVLDPAPAESLSRELLQNVDWFTPNETEATFFLAGAPDISGELQLLAENLQAMGPRSVILKLGARGAYVASLSAEGDLVSPHQVQAVDTTAAGDAFNGAFATGLMLGKSPIESARFAVAAAALSVTRAGAQTSMPRLAEVDEMLTRNLA